MNKIVVGDLLTINNTKYIVLDKITYVDDEYIFVNEMTDNEENTSKIKKINHEILNLLKNIVS